MTLTEAVNRVLELAQKISDYYDAEIPKWLPQYPLLGPNDQEPPPPPEEQQLREFLLALPRDLLLQLRLLFALVYGECNLDNLAEYYEELKGYSDDTYLTEELVIHGATLAETLQIALEELQKHKISLDKLPLKKVKVRRR